MEEGIFYKKGGKSDYCGVEILPNGKDIPRLVIASIEYHDTLSVAGRREVGMWTATFAPNPYTDKKMLLNATCRKRIAKLFWDTLVEDGTPCNGRINLLKNIPVRMTMEKCRDVTDGGTTVGLRISMIPAAPEEEKKAEKKPLPKDKIPAVIKWAKDKKYSFGDVTKFFIMTEEVAAEVKEALK